MRPLFLYHVFCLIFMATIGCSTMDQQSDLTTPAEPTSITDAQRIAWFKEAKFGMFIHWGPYSHLAGEWNGRQLPTDIIAEWIMLRMEIPVLEYRKIAAQFNPVNFDAEEWVQLAKQTGMKYLAITAKHHDGFAMYDSEVSDYNIVDHTPFGRDPMKELSTAARDAGIRFCFYYSHKEDWEHPDAYGNFWDYNEEEQDFEKYLEEKSKPQLRELLTNYGPLGLIWFDRGMYTQEQGREFANIVRELQPASLVNGRVGHYGKELLGDYQNMNDNGMPIGGMDEYWETPQTLNHTWGYSKFDHDWKSPEEVIQRLATIVGKGGNYLLNIGPTGEGVIPEPTVRILKRVGEWVAANGESIYGTTRSPFPPLPWGSCTVKGSKLYLHVFDWPEDGVLTLTGLHNRVEGAYLLVDKSQRLPIQQANQAVYITVPTEPVDVGNTVVVVKLDGSPRVDPPVVVQQADGAVELGFVEARTGGATMKRFNRDGKFHISKWTGPEDTIAWTVDFNRAGDYQAAITYAAQENWQGQPYSVMLGDSRVTAEVQHTGDWYEYDTMDLGVVNVTEPGQYTVTIRPDSNGDEYLMYFQSMELTPVE
jgi:alpha-L-fucosidase